MHRGGQLFFVQESSPEALTFIFAKRNGPAMKILLEYLHVLVYAICIGTDCGLLENNPPLLCTF